MDETDYSVDVDIMAAMDDNDPSSIYQDFDSDSDSGHSSLSYSITSVETAFSLRKKAQALALALIEAAYDKSTQVQTIVGNSLFDIGKKQPKMVLSSAQYYLKKHSKLPIGHRVVILNAMERIVKETIDEIEAPLAVDLVNLASEEMTHNKEVMPDWQTAASNLLVALGANYCNEVMEEILKKFQPGTLPHFFVVQTMAHLASANVFGMVPFMKAVLGTMLPMLGMAKHDNMRWAFSTALGKFCEAILDYIANIDKAPDPSVHKDTYSLEMYSAYDILFNVWLKTNEAKLRLAIVDAVGHMTNLMTSDKLEEQLPRLIPGILGLYRRHNEPFHITEGLCNVLKAAVADESTILEPHLEVLLNELHRQCCVTPDYANPMTVKNHNEVLRCFAVMSQSFCDRIITYLLQKLELANEKLRIGTLSILKHLINSLDALLENKKSLIVTGLKILLPESNNKVKKMFAQVIIAMAHHGYLELEGGELMVEFIVRQCSLPEDVTKKRSADPEFVSNDALRSMCDNILHLGTTTIAVMESVLWPFLLECLVPMQYTSAMNALCLGISHLAAKKRDESPDERLNYDAEPNLPKPCAIIARLMVMAGRPLKGRRGINVIKAMQALAPNLHDNLVELWDTITPKLILYLEDNLHEDEKWSQKSWEDLLLKLLSKTLDEVDDEEFICEIGEAFIEQVPLYQNRSDEKNFMYKCMGVVMRKTSKRDLVDKLLNEMFSSVKHTSQFEREGCAVGLGFCASSHLDAAIKKLETVTKEKMLKKGSGLFSLGFIKDKSEVDVEQIKSTVMLCYGYVTMYAPPDLITSRIEGTILRSMNPHFANIKIKLDPRLTEAETFELVKISTDCVYALPEQIMTAKGKEETYEEAKEQEELVSLTFESLHALLTEILVKNCTPAGIHDIFKHLEPWLYSINNHERERSMNTTLVLLQAYFENMQPYGVSMSTFSNMSTLLARLVPRCTDPVLSIRQNAIDCVQLVLKTALRYEGFSPEHKDQMVDALPVLKDRVMKGDPNILFSVVSDLSKVLSKKIPSDQLRNFLFLLFDGLLDFQSHSSSGACVVLNSVFKSRGHELHSDIADIIDELHDKLTNIQYPQTRTGTLRSIRTLSSHNLPAVLNALLSYQLPFDDHIVDCWKIIAKDAQLAGNVFDQILDILAQSMPFEEKIDQKTQKVLSRYATPLPLTAVCALCEIFKVEETEEVVISNFHRLFSSLLVYCGCMAGTKAPRMESRKEKTSKKEKKPSIRIHVNINPARLSGESLRQLFIRIKSDDLLAVLDKDNVWVTLEDQNKYQEGVTCMAREITEYYPQQVAKIISCLTSSLSSLHDPQRIIGVSFFAELINQRCAGDMSLVEMLMNNLLGRLVDSSLIVRMFCIRGLGNIASVGSEQVQKFCTTVLSAMMAGMDDKEDPDDDITLEAMSGLSKILAEIDENNIRAILINITLRIRPCFEKDRSSVRAAAFSLFGNLSRFGNGPSKAPFLEQIHTNFVSLLLHVNDEDSEVKKACKFCLRQFGPLMGSENMNEMFQNHLLEDANLSYGEFMYDLSKVLIADFPDKVNFYVMGNVSFFKSLWSDIRGNAAMLSGFLLGNLRQDQRNLISKEHVCGALILLLKDQSAEVRIKAAEAMSLLYDY
ncbi:maestro heat-like repeat-containing protein family member 1 [Saccoglossus kowalevskii]